jgi:GntR family transcriptional regulator/MocR family aminotransferase
MLLTLGPASGKTLPSRIRAGILDLVAKGALTAGSPLPSTRQLAQQLGVHRTTVAVAYQELWAQGWIELKPGARARVRARAGSFPEQPAPAPETFSWPERMAGPVRQLASRPRAEPGSGQVISFRSLTMDPRLMPAEAFRACLNRVLRRRGPALLGYGAREGYWPLREYLARRLGASGIRAQPEEILLTRGSQQALDLVFRMLGPGRVVAVEDPTYDQVRPLLELAGQRPAPLPMLRDGLDLEQLEACLERDRPALVYTMPNFQNPTGVCTSQAHRERLLALCQRHGVPILEDGFEEEMKYFGRVAMPLKSMDRTGSVLYCGTFSKVLLPGVRVGWLVAPAACVQALAALRHASELCPDQVLPAALHAFCAAGHYDVHLARMHRRFRSRLRAALTALREHIPPGRARWQEPAGGYLLWLELPEARLDWEAHCARFGVAVTAGARFFAAPASTAYLRLSIAALDESEIREGIRRLGQALAHPPQGAPK